MGRKVNIKANQKMRVIVDGKISFWTTAKLCQIGVGSNGTFNTIVREAFKQLEAARLSHESPNCTGLCTRILNTDIQLDILV